MHPDQTLDKLYDEIDELFKTDQFVVVDKEYIRNTIKYCSKHTDEYLVGVLTATLPAKSHLVYRKELFDTIKKELESRGHVRVDQLLKGLD